MQDRLHVVQRNSTNVVKFKMKYLLSINALGERNTNATRLRFYIIMVTLSVEADSGAHTRLKGRNSSHTACLN